MDTCIIQITFHFSFQDVTEPETIEDNLDNNLTLDRMRAGNQKYLTYIIKRILNLQYFLLGCRDRQSRFWCDRSWCRDIFGRTDAWMARDCPRTCGVC